MRKLNRRFLASFLLAIILLGLFPVAALAAPSDVAVIGSSYTLESGQTLYDGLFILGGSVNLMPGSTVNGTVLLVGGSVEAAGTINGNMVLLGGTVNLASTFVLNGDLTSGGTVLNRDPGARITGQIRTNEGTPNIVIPGQVQIPNLNTNLNPFFQVAWFFLRLFLWALAAMVLVMFIPNHLLRTTQAMLTQPLISGGLGLLTFIIVPILAVLLAITICLIPVSVIALLILVAAWVFGLISMGYEVGKRLSGLSKMEWHPAISAGLGTLLLMAVLSGVEAIIPCVGWIPKLLVGWVGLGAVLLTQFGTKNYSPTPTLPGSIQADNVPPA